MKKIEDLNYYELLEVNPLASSQEIHKAYERVRRVYEPNSVALYSLFSPEETETIHQRIEEAYRTLVYEDNRRRYDAFLRERNELPEPPPPPPKYQPRPVQPALAPPVDRFETRPEQPAPEAAPPPPQFTGEFTGAAIKALREQRGLSLRNVSDTTKISARYLENIEEETFTRLPPRPYIRGFLMLYANALGCDAIRMSRDYLQRYDEAMGVKQKQ
jgi:curved DNA-binding protein CbpA